MVMDDRDKQVWKVLGCGLLLMVLTSALLATIGSVVFMRWSAPPPALRKYHKAADAGDADAMTNIGAMYAKGQDVKQDHTEAMRWYRKAADEGEATAMFNIGFMYDNGHGVKEDYAEAMRWFRKAAGRGDAEAKATLESLKGK